MQKYAEESRFARVLKSQQWQAVIEQCSSRCEGRKREIVRALSLYTATRVDGILDGVAQANAKLAKILKIFALFEPSSRMEEQLNAEILARGGADVCLASDEKLNALASLKCAMDDGPNMIYLAGKGRKLTYGELRKIRSPVEKELANNLARFERKLDDASLKLDKAIKHLRTLTTRPYQKIEDPDIRKLWRDMGWGGSVESQTFVLNLYDYFIDLVREAHGSPSSGDAAESSPIPAVVTGSTPETSLIIRPASPTPSDTGTEADREEFEGRTTPEKASEDAWCLRYFKYTTVSTFMEVIDNDANGLIKIKEVNEFVASRPGDISLMQWLAYCAYGWVVAIYIYRLRTEWLLEQMLSLDYTKENSTAFVSYTESLIWIVGYLRSMNEPVLDEQRLLRLVHDIMRTHEKSLGEELSRLEYDISGPSTMSLLGASINERAGGTERVESYILPIFYLCMRHHFDIMRLSTFYVLDESEFDTATSTVQQIGSALRSRLDGLHAHFQKMQEDLGQKFRYFATGMFGDMHSLVWNFSTPETLDKMVTGWCLPWTSQRALEWPLRDYDDPLGLVFHDYNPSDRHPDRTLFPKIPVPELLGDAPSDEEYGRLMCGLRGRTA